MSNVKHLPEIASCAFAWTLSKVLRILERNSITIITVRYDLQLKKTDYILFQYCSG